MMTRVAARFRHRKPRDWRPGSFVAQNHTMTRTFAVTRTRGEAWDPSRPLEAQDGWQPHAAFMNALHSDGFVVLGGPLDGTADVLLIVRARDEAEIRSRLQADPWSDTNLLTVARIVPWTIRLGSL